MYEWLFAFGLFTGEFVFYLWDLLPAVYLTQPELFNKIDFSIGSSINDLQSGMLIEGDLSTDPIINLAKGIKDRQAFYNQLENAWRKMTIK
jgi:hypothetical protein